jgi:hypothetical protein
LGPSCSPHLMLHPLLASCLQSLEILLNKGTYEILRPRIKCITLQNIYSYSTQQLQWWVEKRSGKERTRQTQFSTKFAAKSCTPWSPVRFFFSCFLKSHPLCDQTGGFWCFFFLTLRITSILMLVLLGYFAKFIISSLRCPILTISPSWPYSLSSLFCQMVKSTLTFTFLPLFCYLTIYSHLDDVVCQVCFAKRLVYTT